MAESFRKLGLLVHKNWLVRKRQWLLSLIAEIILPVGIIACTWALRGLSAKPPMHINTESHYRMQSQTELIDQLYNEHNNSINIYYAPNNSFVNDLMKTVDDCFKHRSKIHGFKTEKDFMAYYYQHMKFMSGMAVIFDDDVSESTKNLHYKMRGKYMTANNVYNVMPPVQNMTYYYTKSHAYTQVQICLDESFVKMKGGEDIQKKMFIQKVPYPPYTVYDAGDAIFRQAMNMLLVTAFFIPLFIETSKATGEKFLGINVLMSMNGISNALNLFSWLISGLAFLCIVCVIPILIFFILPVGDGLAYVHYGNPFILFLLFAAYVGHLLAYGVHVSAYFSRSLLVMFALLIVNVLTVVLKMYAFTEDTFYLVPYVGILLPNLLIQQSMEEVSYYETIAEGIQWNNMFVTGNAAYETGGSVGMILILSAIGMIFHYVMAIYVYAINPGKYGVRKNPLFFLKWKSKKYGGDKTENLSYEGMNGKPFEPIPEGIYEPGIQLRNLQKAYNISLFSKGKVHALKGISVDFYRGQITSLLGHNGAGKTTMMSILTGMMSPTDGLVLINSKDMAEHSSEIMNDMGLCTQENMLFPCLSVIEQIEFFAKLKRKDKSKSAVREEVKAFLHKLKLYEKRHALPKQLSGGQKRRVCLGMALVGDSSTLILDEPTSGLDPESRRLIWDILLKLRGQKTILISTHDMEEADILGDRIAIIHSGQLRSCGTSLFLKKLIGRGNVEVTLSVEADCDPQKICAAFACEGILVNRDGSKVVLSIPNTPELPDQLDTLEKKKKELGVIGFSVSLISLEQVFLKVTQENDGPIKIPQSLTNDDEKLTGDALFFQSARALLLKKMTYTAKNMSIVLLKLLTVFMALLSISLILKQASVSTQMTSKITSISLDMYNRPSTYYSSYDKTIGDQYKNITQGLYGKAMEATDSSLSSAMIKYARKSLPNYENHLIAAAEFNDTKIFNAFYSDKAVFSLPISVNLIWNTIIKTLLGNDYSINLSNQELPSTMFSDMTMMNGIMTAVVFVFQFCATIALFVIHPLRESSKGVKQLQRMTGVSGSTYWGTMFLFDFMVYSIIVALIIIGFATMDYILELRLYGFYEISLQIFLFVIFAVNTLPLVYIFSFINGKISTVVRLLTYVSMGSVIFELVMHAMKATLSRYKTVEVIRYIQKAVFLFIPYVSFFHSQMSFYLTAQNNARCAKMPNEFYDSQCKMSHDVCCEMGCYNQTCNNYKSFFTHFEEDITMEESLIYLCLTPIIYFGVLALLETQFIQIMIARFRDEIVQEFSTDEQVQREKSTISQKIQELNGNGSYYKSQNDNNFNTKDSQKEAPQNKSDNSIFLVYDLRKSYKKLTAVQDVSFGVNRYECFGLLGVNGAGKSTTFRMMTGGEVPDNGIMYINGTDIKNNKNYFLSQMGYCPQQDAIIKSLNSYDHLRLFARLRGIPENKVESEVQAWIEKLNLTVCALQPSGTYSGGNRRRLNIAIALIGNPNLVLMDEPTTGVDPGARRSLWNVIKSCQTAGQAVVLTSHSMEECEALCNRLAIMVGGRFVCIGPSEELKQRFGAGYDIQIRIDPAKMNDQLENIKKDMKHMLDVELTDENLGYLMYHVAPNNITWRKMYDVMNDMKSKYNCIDDFSVLSSSLEQLFLLFARSANRSSWSSDKSVII